MIESLNQWEGGRDVIPVVATPASRLPRSGKSRERCERSPKSFVARLRRCASPRRRRRHYGKRLSVREQGRHFSHGRVDVLVLPGRELGLTEPHAIKQLRQAVDRVVRGRGEEA